MHAIDDFDVTVVLCNKQFAFTFSFGRATRVNFEQSREERNESPRGRVIILRHVAAYGPSDERRGQKCGIEIPVNNNHYPNRALTWRTVRCPAGNSFRSAPS